MTALDLDDSFLRRLHTLAHHAAWKAGVLGRVDPLDLAQDAAIELGRLDAAGELKTRDPAALLRGLAATMLARRAIDAGRRPALRKERPAPHKSERLVGTAHALDGHPADDTSTSGRLARIDARERAREVLDFVAERERLDPTLDGDYELLVRRLVEDIEYPEIARQRGRGESAEAVRSRLRRLKEEIQERFREWGTGEGGG